MNYGDWKRDRASRKEFPRGGLHTDHNMSNPRSKYPSLQHYEHESHVIPFTVGKYIYLTSE